jgi:hypothetical protein
MRAEGDCWVADCGCCCCVDCGMLVVLRAGVVGAGLKVVVLGGRG